MVYNEEIGKVLLVESYFQKVYGFPSNEMKQEITDKSHIYYDILFKFIHLTSDSIRHKRIFGGRPFQD